MLHSLGKNQATGDLTQIETLFSDLFGVTTSALSHFFFFDILNLKYHYFYRYSCLNKNKSIVYSQYKLSP